MPRIESEELVDILTDYIQNPPEPPHPDADPEQEVVDALLKRDYSEAIKRANDHRNGLLNIKKTKISGKVLDDLDIIIFDTREMKKGFEEPYSDYLRIATNYIRAAQALFRIERRLDDTIEQQLNQMIVSYYHTIRESRDFKKDFKEFNWYLINFVASRLGYSFDEMKERLLLTKDYVNLEDPSNHYVTISNDKIKEKEHIHFSADLGLYELTDDQKREIKNRGTSYKIVEDPLTRKKRRVDTKNWYNTRPRWIRRLMDYYVPRILNEKHVMPTQLRRDFPVGLNAGLQVDGYYDNDMGEFSIDLDIFHSGSLAHFGTDHKENMRVAALKRDQLNALTGDHGVLNLTLCDEMNIFHVDRQAVQDTHEVLKEEEFDHANLPPNPMRRVSPNIYSGINNLLSVVADDIRNEIAFQINGNGVNIRAIADFLEMKKKKFYGEDKKAKTALDLVKELKDVLGDRYELVYAAIICRQLIRKNLKLKDSENLNRQIATFVCIINSLLRKDEQREVKTLILSCLAGKDRTREILINATLFKKMYVHTGVYPYEGYPEFLSSKDHKQLFELLLKNIVATGPHQQLAGCERTSIACTGLKSGFRKLPSSYPRKHAEPLHRATAMFNSLIPAIRQNKSPFYQPRIASVQSLLVALEAKRTHLIARRAKAHKTLSMLFYSKGVCDRKIHCIESAIAEIRSGNVKTDKQAKDLSRQLASALKRTVEGTLYRRGETFDMANDYYETLVTQIAGRARIR